MRKRIAVFICAISFSSQKRILSGILEEAKKADFDVFVFTCHMNHSASHMKINGAFSVMMLPDFSNFDGVIIMKSTIRQTKIADDLVGKILKSKVPAVSIEEDIEGMHYVGISDYEAQKKIVNHIIEEHLACNICYVTGLTDSDDGNNRFQAYKDAMTEHGLKIKEENIFYGNYIGDSGQLAVDKFLDRKEKIDAIICANDGMALGAINELNRRGYNVPKDIMVTGFDNDTFSRYSIPMLTTIDQNQEEIGKTAVQLLAEPSGKEYVNKTIPSKLVLGESCGCLETVGYSIDEIRASYSKEIGVISRAVDVMKNMSIELAGLTTMDELYARLTKYIKESDMEAFFLCIEEGNKLKIPLARIDGTFKRFDEYEKGLVLPLEACNSEKPQFYIVNSLFYNDMNFGYIIQRGSRFALESELAYSWVVNIGIAVENIRKIGLMQEMLNRLNSVWMYDALTNLLNRAGFYHFADSMLEKIKEKKGRCYLVFCDLDGLKAVNDNQGHEIGDKYISTMAAVLNSSLKNIENESSEFSSLAMRYGGDEFVLFGECENEDKTNRIMEIIGSEIDKANEKETDFSLSCSMGLSIHDALKISDLNSLIEEADKKMYESKKRKKKSIMDGK